MRYPSVILRHYVEYTIYSLALFTLGVRVGLKLTQGYIQTLYNGEKTR